MDVALGGVDSSQDSTIARVETTRCYEKFSQLIKIVCMFVLTEFGSNKSPIFFQQQIVLDLLDIGSKILVLMFRCTYLVVYGISQTNSFTMCNHYCSFFCNCKVCCCSMMIFSSYTMLSFGYIVSFLAYRS